MDTDRRRYNQDDDQRNTQSHQQVSARALRHGFVGTIVETQELTTWWLQASQPRPGVDGTGHYPTEMAILSVQPQAGALRLGPAHVLTATGRRCPVLVLGGHMVSQRVVRTPDGDQTLSVMRQDPLMADDAPATPTTQPAQEQFRSPSRPDDQSETQAEIRSEINAQTRIEVIQFLRLSVQGLEPALWVGPGEPDTQSLRLEQAVDTANEKPGDPLDDTRRRAAQRWEIRHAAVQILAILLGPEAPVAPLLRALADEARPVRWLAAEALSRLGARAPLDPFLVGIQDIRTENQGLRRAAPAVFEAHAQDPRALDALQALLHDEDGLVQSAAARVLGHLGLPTPVTVSRVRRRIRHPPLLGLGATRGRGPALI